VFQFPATWIVRLHPGGNFLIHGFLDLGGDPTHGGRDLSNILLIVSALTAKGTHELHDLSEKKTRSLNQNRGSAGNMK
jgi:hypothetical protein